MPKIIFTSRYLRDAPPARLENYVRYIGTREGVEKIDASRPQLPVTSNQKNLIRQLIRDIPTAKEMLEYTDFLLQRTTGNASEFISCALEQNLDLVSKRENYVDYIANRPRVQRIGEHGLYTDASKPVILSQVQEEVTNHKGDVWTHVVSLRREDAARLGYDSAEQWMALLRSKRAMLCKHMKIDSENLRWYAAFHNESYHPHVHLMVYSAKDNDGYLTEKSIEAMRSELAHDMFRQDFAHIYEEQNQARAELKQKAAETMETLLRHLENNVCDNPMIAELMLKLSGRLQNTGGKKVYGYLKRDVKAIIDRIIDELAKEPCVAELYAAWGGWQNEILKTYQNKTPSLPPLSRQPQFKSMKNMVIAEALKLGDHHVTFEDETLGVRQELAMVLDSISDDVVPLEELEDISLRAEWSERYKLAREYLYGSRNVPQNFEKAFQLFLLEAESGNALAMHDLGRMLADGLGRDVDMTAAQEWYGKALTAFRVAEQSAEERQCLYLQYRIGKMYAAGLGTDKDYVIAAKWFSKAATANHKYAQYSLAGLTYRGQGVEQSYENAFSLYFRSANQGNPYASYELAKMLRDGVGTQENAEQARQYFEKAYTGFLILESQSHDDKLQYRIGHMLHTGTGTKQDDEAAAFYWERSAKLGNSNAQYALGKLYLTGEDIPKDVEAALHWLGAAADQGNQFAQYALGKLYLCGHDIPRDREKAALFLQASAAQGNIYAQFLLEHMDSFRDPSVFLATTRLMRQLCNAFREDYRKATGNSSPHIDRKRRRKLQEKKQAQGHAHDDYEQQIQY